MRGAESIGLASGVKRVAEADAAADAEFVCDHRGDAAAHGLATDEQRLGRGGGDHFAPVLLQQVRSIGAGTDASERRRCM